MDRVPYSTEGLALRRPPQRPDAWVLMGIGAFLAPVLAFVPLLRFVGWFLASLVHEMGHCAAAWLFGAPAFPAIRLDGHAAAMHTDQKMVLVALLYAGLLAIAWQCRQRPLWRWVTGAGVLLYPVLALTEAHEVIHLLAGHWSELAFAGVFFFRALSGGFTDSAAERVTYAAVAWFLLGKNVVLDFGLMTDAAARGAYIGNGSFGIAQDFVRAARALDVSLGAVGGLMLLFSLATLPLAIFVWRCSEEPEPADQNGGYACGKRIDIHARS